ncbi:MAG: serine hydrolase domain-containing protein [Pseudomonadota bacterium]
MGNKFFYAIILLGVGGVVWGQEESDLSARIDAVFAEYDAPNVPGCAVGVIHDGTYVHAKGYGSANLEHGIPISPSSVFRIGSVSKQFTAAAIAILASRGELDLDADVRQYLPDLRKYDNQVTIRQMVHHTSGMGEYDLSYEVAPGRSFRFGNEDYWTVSEFYREVLNKPLALAPGERFVYSNIAYFLLSQVVEKVSGKTLREFTKQEIFGPLEMQATFFNDNIDGIVPNRADGYLPLKDGSFEIFMTNLDWVGDGGVYTSLNDFIKWDQAFMTNQVPGGAEVQRLMETPDPLTEDTMESYFLDEGAGYGYGLEIGKYKGHRIHFHTGSWVGFRAAYARFAEADYSAVVMCNRSDVASGSDKRRELLDVVVAEFSNE